ncbi:MAG: Maf family nucleotide pyrophosphatase [Prevotellaceae bacterium]|jgi:septum formation protein|nr:Maf family nucleotide pyrophosphatase [Prevotellaceae bacterium]
MLKNLSDYHLILGSQSPRRQELIKGLDIDVEIKNIDVEENYPEKLIGAEIPVFLAEKKADAYQLARDTLLITADTIVWMENNVLGKPKTEDDAREMLNMLSGKTHQVITGVCISSLKKRKTFHAISNVRFSAVGEEEIDYYIKKYRPLDKAGAYGVQEWIGYIGVEYIEGSYYNIMGLPIQKLYTELKKW